MIAQIFGFASALENKYKELYKLIDFELLKYIDC